MEEHPEGEAADKVAVPAPEEKKLTLSCRLCGNTLSSDEVQGRCCPACGAVAIHIPKMIKAGVPNRHARRSERHAKKRKK